MKHQIKSRRSGNVLFEADIPDGTESELVARVALEQAVESDAYLHGANLRGAYLHGAYLHGANLGGANLRGANLDGANLRGAYLRGAYLDGANLDGAYLDGAYLGEICSIWGVTGNMKEVKSLHIETWPVAYTATHMQIGCQMHPISDWWAFDDERIDCMSSDALEWWRKWKPVLQQLIEISPAVPGADSEPD